MNAGRSIRQSIETVRSVVRFGPVETDPVERRLAGPPRSTTCAASPSGVCPAACFDYIDGGAEDERTLAANPAPSPTTSSGPRVLRGLPDVDVGIHACSAHPVAYPLVLAPTGFTRIADPAGRARRRPRRPSGPGCRTRCRR